MFGDYLKQLRVQHGLTQRELATKLNLSSPEFTSVDSVTISRWERNATTPNSVKAIKVLRQLTLDLKPYLLTIEASSEGTILDDILYDRFHSQRALLMSSEYEELKPQKDTKIIEESMFSNETADHASRLKNFFINADAHYPGLIDLDLLSFHKEDKVIANVYLDEESHKVRGHSISFLFKIEDLESLFTRPEHTLPFSLAKPYTENRELALCCLSRYAANQQVFMMLHPTLVDYLAARSNITSLYYYSFDNQFSEYLVSLGAEKVAYDSPDKSGSVTIGKTAYRKCLLKIDTSILLAQSSMIYLLHQHQRHSKRC
ncbi:MULTISPECIES: helix-turn-helix domain-containing protein [Vibrio harveyi group]|uniref:helix-turn-helix domain-containing protein n=1 Tax=Vibrio harveyi group TaxID=717610 RepID=UPI00039F819F|nr:MULTISPECIES: helix-turn-helix transcriptional regulator [Vibrio harveyi group]PAW12628.1 XRE family transcriptional regulator [Vibrio sp. V1B]